MNFPQSLSQIFLLCGTNNPASTSPAVLSATVIEILSAIANNCPTAFIHFYPILPHFDHCYSFVQVTSSHFFQVQECFSEKVFYDLPSSLCTGMTKSIWPTREMTFWSDGSTITLTAILNHIYSPPSILLLATFLQLLNPHLYRQTAPVHCPKLEAGEKTTWLLIGQKANLLAPDWPRAIPSASLQPVSALSWLFQKGLQTRVTRRLVGSRKTAV